MDEYFPVPKQMSREQWDSLKMKFMADMVLLQKLQCKSLYAAALLEAHRIDYFEFTAHFTRPN